MKIQGKVALVTGAGSGIGQATARALAKAGAKLIVCDVDAAALDAFAAELGVACLLHRVVDVSNREAMRAFADEVHAVVPAVDILVNNAGVGLSGSCLQTSLEDWDWLLGINLYGVIHGLHFFLPKMVERGQGGHVVNLSSLAGYWVVPELSAYLTSKHAVFGLTESLRLDLQGTGIGATAVCPGVINTNIVKNTRYRNTDKPEAMKKMVVGAYAKRNYGPERVAAAIVRGIERNAGILPVSPESWAMYFINRLSVPLSRGLARMTQRGITKP